MSWCRYNSRCDMTIPQYEEDVACAKAGCPGSSLSIYEESDQAIVCHGCNFKGTENEMKEHILWHDQQGHHVRRSILLEAQGKKPTLTEAWRELRDLYEAAPVRGFDEGETRR